MKAIKYLVVGFIFGIVLTKSEAVSWYRIYEMFQFQSFHMYGIIMVLLGIYNKIMLPSGMQSQKAHTVKETFATLKDVFITFFQKKNIWFSLCFIVSSLYRHQQLFQQYISYRNKFRSLNHLWKFQIAFLKFHFLILLFYQEHLLIRMNTLHLN